MSCIRASRKEGHVLFYGYMVLNIWHRISQIAKEMGVPQGSILSVTLFSVKINSITQCLKPGVDCSLYIDDFQVCYRSSNMSIIERQLQLCLNKLQQWATDNGFQFSKTKPVCMHICQKRGLHLDPQLFLDKSPIPVVEDTKFLGVIFDRKLSFVPHLKYVKKRGLKALNILKVNGNTEWGADRKVMLRLYRSLVRSKLDYGCIVYGSACKSYLQREREMFYLTTHSIHFIYGYMASDISLRTILIVRKETHCRHIGYSYRLTARVLLYAPSHRQDNTYHGLCYTSRGALAGTRNSSMGPPHEGSIRRSIAP